MSKWELQDERNLERLITLRPNAYLESAIEDMYVKIAYKVYVLIIAYISQRILLEKYILFQHTVA